MFSSVIQAPSGTTRASGDEGRSENDALARLGIRPEQSAPVEDEPHRAEADEEGQPRDHEAEGNDARRPEGARRPLSRRSWTTRGPCRTASDRTTPAQHRQRRPRRPRGRARRRSRRAPRGSRAARRRRREAASALRRSGRGARGTRAAPGSRPDWRRRERAPPRRPAPPAPDGSGSPPGVPETRPCARNRRAGARRPSARPATIASRALSSAAGSFSENADR